jgi:uncharacterized protein (TIGR00369 family)
VSDTDTDSDTEHFRRLERMFHDAPCNQAYEHVDLTVGRGEAELVLRAEESMHHPGGGVHGTYYFKLLDDAAFFAANSLVEDVFVLTTEFNLYLERPVSTGDMVAHGEVVNDNPRQLLAEAVVHDADGNEIARGTGSFSRSSVELDESIGYR